MRSCILRVRLRAISIRKALPTRDNMPRAAGLVCRAVEPPSTLSCCDAIGGNSLYFSVLRICFFYVVLNAAARRSFLFRHKVTHYLYMQGHTMRIFCVGDVHPFVVRGILRIIQVSYAIKTQYRKKQIKGTR